METPEHPERPTEAAKSQQERKSVKESVLRLIRNLKRACSRNPSRGAGREVPAKEAWKDFSEERVAGREAPAMEPPEHPQRPAEVANSQQERKSVKESVLRLIQNLKRVCSRNPSRGAGREVPAKEAEKIFRNDVEQQ